jgi:hypothetical protein
LFKSDMTGARSERRPDKASGMPCCAAWKKHPRSFLSSKVCALYTPPVVSPTLTPVKELTIPVLPLNSTVSGYFVTRTSMSAFGIVSRVTRQAYKPGDEY